MKWALILLLAGCQAAPITVPIDRPVRVEVPVPVACLSSVPPRPATTDDQALQLLDDEENFLATELLSHLDHELIVCIEQLGRKDAIG